MLQRNADVKELGLGRKIRTLREAKKLSIEDVAGRASLTPILLSQIESEAVTPPVATLLKLAHALDAHIGDFFVEAGPHKRYEVVRSGEHKKVARKPAPGKSPLSYSYEALAYRLTERHMEPFLTEFDIDIQEDVPPVSHEGEEFVYVLEGEVEFHAEDEIVRLNQGDSLYFDSSMPHAFVGKGNTKPRAVVVIYPES
ncbi:MAG: helix-turn-helix transcriptional regulator [Candidatus Lindowbacteria bacterium]|nr:helix-turn-helix transcriptional regulator [Candidatus Lindowbacteria bacterium]